MTTPFFFKNLEKVRLRYDVVELEQYKYQWNQYADQLEELRKAFDIQAKKERIEEIEGIMEEQGFWII